MSVWLIHVLVLIRYKLELWGAEHILKEILPAGCEVPSSFETIGMFMWVVYINCMIWTQCEPQLQTLQPQALNLLCGFGNVDLPRSSTYICLCKLLSRPDMWYLTGRVNCRAYCTSQLAGGTPALSESDCNSYSGCELFHYSFLLYHHLTAVAFVRRFIIRF